MEEQMSGAAVSIPQDPRQAFKVTPCHLSEKQQNSMQWLLQAEWEALQLSSHQWALKNADGELLAALKRSP